MPLPAGRTAAGNPLDATAVRRYDEHVTTDDDRAWLDDVAQGRVARFGHRDHIRLACVALDASGSLPEAVASVSAVVEGLAARAGVPQKYHRTVTEAWVRIIAHCRADAAAGGGTGTTGTTGRPGADDLVERYPWLLDKRLLTGHYTSSVLASAPARSGWVPPDLLPVPEP